MTKWFYSYDGKTQRVQIGDDFEDGPLVHEINSRFRIHVDHDNRLVAVEIDDGDNA